jgi:NDP-sugar pyrophosphorylase family protein
MKILVPLAARDQFFKAEEYFFPKPLVEVNGQPMIKLAIENLRRIDTNAHFVFVVNRDDVRQYNLDNILRLLTDGRCTVVELSYPTKGAVCSSLMAIDHIDDDEPLIIANSDQVIDADVGELVRSFAKRELDGGVIVFDSVHPRWSYVRQDEQGSVVETAEKRVISRQAIAGFYWFRRGRDFVRASQQLIEHGRSTSGIYYVSATLNELVLDGKRVGAERIATDNYHSFYSPQKLVEYERALQARAILGHGGKRSAGGQRNVTVMIPMAGRGSRFADVGFKRPKPFIDVEGKLMIEQVLDNLRIPGARYVLLALAEHLEATPEFASRLRARPDVEIVPVKQVTEGTPCTVLLGRTQIDPDGPLLIANCDQLIDFDVNRYVNECLDGGWDGSILVFRDHHRDPKWSFAKTDADGMVTEVREKVAISDLATVGLYFFARGRDFIDWTVDMIARNDRTKGEFYTCPVYNHGVAVGARIGVHEIKFEQMHGLGTPADLEAYLGARGKKVRKD